MRASYQAVVDGAVELQERNVRVTQSQVEGYIRWLRRQSDRNWEMAEELAGRAEEQSDAFRTLVGQSVDAYVDLLRTPFFHHEKARRTAR